MKYLATSLFIILCCFSLTAQRSLSDLLTLYNTRTVPYVSVEELRMLQLNGKVIILDTRERSEYDVSKIPSAIYAGYSEFSSEMIQKKIPNTETSIVVYCSLGIRSEEIGEKLQKAGYMNVRNLYGGIFEWKNNGYAVVNSEGTETEKVHACSKIWGKWLKKGEPVYD